MCWGGYLEEKGREFNMGGRGRVLRALLGVVLFMGFILFLLIGIETNYEATTITVMISSSANSRFLNLIGTERHDVHWDLDLNYVSKRRVPNGADPIHNRKAGKFKLPPGRA